MGFYDRDYSRDYGRPPGWTRMRMLSVTTWLIIINVAVLVIDSVLVRAGWRYVDAAGRLYPPLEGLGFFSKTMALDHFQVWRFITFQFLHAGFEHLLFNMLALYFFGQLVESYLGRVRYLTFYLVCGIGGALFYLVLWGMGMLDSGPLGRLHGASVPLVGASAGIFGVLIGAARIAPDTTVMLLFPPIPMRLKTMAWVFIGIAVLVILRQGPNAGGQAAHLGGAGVGFLLIRYPKLLQPFSFRRRKMRLWRDGAPWDNGPRKWR